MQIHSVSKTCHPASQRQEEGEALPHRNQ